MRGDPKWINQHAYDVQWKGKTVRVLLKKLRPISPISTKLLRDAGKRIAEVIAHGE